MEETLAIKNLMEKNSKLKWTVVIEIRKEKIYELISKNLETSNSAE